ncbi:hypothetical protein LWI29_004268 [Acer saccharum]|uniref:Uncharacterized protein n=1 Tax=Acer saccharum TaxID=4024 RepID=A0AA39SQL6_ACESA|nr:hypothetical protein LWI29_004268 [Acer saccharum]
MAHTGAEAAPGRGAHGLNHGQPLWPTAWAVLSRADQSISMLIFCPFCLSLCAFLGSFWWVDVFVKSLQIGGHPTADSTAEFKRRFHSAARPPITNRGENQGDAKCISIGGLRAKPSTF